MLYTTLNGQIRFEVRQWWTNIFTKGFRSKVGIYNNGYHLYIDGGSPGRFINQGSPLKFFPFIKMREQVGEINILHGGHAHITPSGGGYGQATVFATTNSSFLRIHLQSMQMAYIVLMPNGSFEWKFLGMHLPSSVLENVGFRPAV